MHITHITLHLGVGDVGTVRAGISIDVGGMIVTCISTGSVQKKPSIRCTGKSTAERIVRGLTGWVICIACLLQRGNIEWGALDGY